MQFYSSAYRPKSTLVSINNARRYELVFIVAIVFILHLLFMFLMQFHISLPSPKRADLEIQFATLSRGTNSLENTVGNSSDSKSKPNKAISKSEITKPVEGQANPQQQKIQSAPSQNQNSVNNSGEVGNGSSFQVAGVDTMEASGKNSNPTLVKNPKPIYPKEAYREGYEGVVVVDIEVLESGEVGRALIHKSSKHELLDESALSAVKKWKFSPGVKSGKVIKQWVRVPITFSLKNQ